MARCLIVCKVVFKSFKNQVLLQTDFHISLSDNKNIIIVVLTTFQVQYAATMNIMGFFFRFGCVCILDEIGYICPIKQLDEMQTL